VANFWKLLSHDILGTYSFIKQIQRQINKQQVHKPHTRRKQQERTASYLYYNHGRCWSSSENGPTAGGQAPMLSLNSIPYCCCYCRQNTGLDETLLWSRRTFLLFLLKIKLTMFLVSNISFHRPQLNKGTSKIPLKIKSTHLSLIFTGLWLSQIIATSKIELNQRFLLD